MPHLLPYLPLLPLLPPCCPPGCPPAPAPAPAPGREPTLVLYNGPPTLYRRSLGRDGSAVGDIIAWHASLVEQNQWCSNVVGTCNGTMIVTRDALGDGREHRMTNIELDWDGGPDSLLVAGSHPYPVGQNETDTPIVRAVTGGTGKWAGAAGEMISTRLSNGYYRHDIYLL